MRCRTRDLELCHSVRGMHGLVNSEALARRNVPVEHLDRASNDAGKPRSACSRERLGSM